MRPRGRPGWPVQQPPPVTPDPEQYPARRGDGPYLYSALAEGFQRVLGDDIDIRGFGGAIIALDNLGWVLSPGPTNTSAAAVEAIRSASSTGFGTEFDGDTACRILMAYGEHGWMIEPRRKPK